MSAPASAVVDEITPVPTGRVPSGGTKWSPVELVPSMTLSGGYQSKAWVCETKDVQVVMNGKKKTINFVKVDKKAPWLFKAAVGPKGQSGCLKRSKVIDCLLYTSDAADE